MTITREDVRSEHYERLMQLLHEHGDQMPLNDFITAPEVVGIMSRAELRDALGLAVQLGRIGFKDLASVVYTPSP